MLSHVESSGQPFQADASRGCHKPPPQTPSSAASPPNPGTRLRGKAYQHEKRLSADQQCNCQEDKVPPCGSPRGHPPPGSPPHPTAKFIALGSSRDKFWTLSVAQRWAHTGTRGGTGRGAGVLQTRTPISRLKPKLLAGSLARARPTRRACRGRGGSRDPCDGAVPAPGAPSRAAARLLRVVVRGGHVVGWC